MNQHFKNSSFPELKQDPIWKTIYEALEAAHSFLKMDVTFLGQFYGDKEFYRSIIGDGKSFGLEENLSLPKAETYCQAMIEGRIGSVIPNTANDPVLMNLKITQEAQIGKFIGAPIHLPYGKIYGALCGLGHKTDLSLGLREERFLKLLASVIQNGLRTQKEDSFIMNPLLVS